MDANRDEATRCLQLSNQWSEAGRLTKAIRFAKKSIALYSTTEAQETLLKLQTKYKLQQKQRIELLQKRNHASNEHKSNQPQPSNINNRQQSPVDLQTDYHLNQQNINQEYVQIDYNSLQNQINGNHSAFQNWYPNISSMVNSMNIQLLPIGQRLRNYAMPVHFRKPFSILFIFFSILLLYRFLYICHPIGYPPIVRRQYATNDNMNTDTIYDDMKYGQKQKRKSYQKQKSKNSNSYDRYTGSSYAEYQRNERGGGYDGHGYQRNRRTHSHSYYNSSQTQSSFSSFIFIFLIVIGLNFLVKYFNGGQGMMPNNFGMQLLNFLPLFGMGMGFGRMRFGRRQRFPRFLF